MSNWQKIFPASALKRGSEWINTLPTRKFESPKRDIKSASEEI